MRKECYFLRAFLSASLLCGLLTSEAATIRVFNAVAPAEPGNIARIWAKLIADVNDPVDLGYVGPGQYIEWTDPLAPPLSGTVTFYYTYDPAEQFWWNAQGFATMQAAAWVTASMGGQVTPYVYIAPSNMDLAWFGRVRLWNRTATVQTVVMNPQVTLTIPAGENLEWELELNSQATAGTPFWSQYLTVFPSDTLNTNMLWLFWTLQDHSGYTQMHIEEGGSWAYCLTHAVPFDDNGVDMTPIEWGPCSDAGLVPPNPGEGGGGGGGGGGGEGNGTNGGGGGEGGGGGTIIDLTELIGLATVRNNLLGLALACCEEGHVVAKNVSSTNSLYLLEIIELLQPADVNSTDPATIVQGTDDADVEVDGAAGGLFAPMQMLIGLGANPIAEPAEAAFRIEWDGNFGAQGWAGGGGGVLGMPDHVSFDYRDVTGAETISGWTTSVIAMVFVGIWLWAVYKHYEKMSAELWATPQASTSGESIIGTNLNIATALVNAGIIISTVAGLWIFAAIALGTVPCLDVIIGAFGDINAPAGGVGGNSLGVVLWTAAEFIPITCALTLVGTYIFLRVTAMVQVQTYKVIIKFAVA